MSQNVRDAIVIIALLGVLVAIVVTGCSTFKALSDTAPTREVHVTLMHCILPGWVCRAF